MKRLLSLLLTALLLVPFASPFVQAEETTEADANADTAVHTLVALGDSIAAGYGMPGFDPHDLSKAKGCFANLLAAHYQLTYGSGMYNFAHTGLTSSDILTSLRSTDKDTLKQAELIVISSGSNDILDIMEEVVYKAYWALAEELSAQGITIDFSDLNAIEQNLLSLLTDPTKQDIVDRFLEECTNEQVRSRCQDAVLRCESNLKEMISYLREIGSQAQIFVITPYNPTTAVMHNQLSETLQNLLDDMRQRYLTVSESAEYGYAVELVDLLTDFEGKYLEMTNITSWDIHPSAAGHELIADTIIRRMDLLSEQKHTDQQKQQHQTAPVADIWVYVIFALAVAAVIAILLHSMIRRRNK